MIQVRISTQPIRTETSTQRAVQNLQSPSAQLDISTQAATVEISQPQGVLTIDNYPCRSAIGLLNSADMIAGFAQQGQQAAQEVTARYVQDGNRMADDIRDGSPSTVAQIADERSMPPQLDITLAHVPLPDISYQASPVQISWTPARLNQSAQANPVRSDYTAGRVDTRVVQYASINITTAQSSNLIDVQS